MVNDQQHGAQTMQAVVDLQYWNDGLFTRFIPNTPAGEDAWKEMAKRDGVAAVLKWESKAVIRQLRTAGYTVRKAKKNDESIDIILRELQV